MGLFSKKENIYKLNCQFLKDNGKDGFTVRGEASKFMKSKGLNFKKDKLTPELFEEFINQIDNEKKSETAHSFNENFLKDKGYGIVKRGDVISFMKSIGLNYNEDKLTEDLFNQYIQFKEDSKSASSFNDDFLKDKGIGFSERLDIRTFMKTIGLDYDDDRITEDLFTQYINIQEKKEIKKEEKKLEKERLKEEKRIQKEKEKIISDFNENFLKEHNIGFLEKEDFKSFLTSINVNYNEDKLTEDLFNQYIQFKEDSKSASSFNDDFLKDKGIGFSERLDIRTFMKTIGLDYDDDRITEDLFTQYINIQEKKEIKKEEKKLEKERLNEISKFNKKFLKNHGIGFSERGNFKAFLEYIGLDYNTTKINEDLFNQYVQLKEERIKTYDFNKQFLKDHGVGVSEEATFKRFIKSRGLMFNEVKFTDEFFEEYLQFKEENERLNVEKHRQKEKEKLEKLGVVGYDFECNLHEKRMNTWGQQKTELYDGYCFVEENRLIIKKRSLYRNKDVGDKIIPYSKINSIDYDKATGFHVTSSIVIAVSGFGRVILKNTTQENFQQLNDAWLNYNTKPTTDQTPQIIEKNTTTAADELLKYAELYEKGLLTKEEFEIKKSELLGINKYNTTSEENSHPKSDTYRKLDLARRCPNCGNKLEPNSKFCSNCGFNLN